MWGDIAIAFLLAFITTFAVVPYTMVLAKKVGAIDIPNERRINKKPMPRLGGVAVITGFLVSVVYLIITMTIEKSINLVDDGYSIKLIGYFAGILVLAGACFVDDSKGIKPLCKLAAQIIAAICVVAAGVRIGNINIPIFDTVIRLNEGWTFALTVAWIIGVTNAINLIDGLDGLSSGVTLIACLSLLIIFSINGAPMVSIILITALSGALVGFLPYNFNPAKTFIGDTGSNFLGFSLAVISIMGVAKTYTAIVIIAPIIVLALPIFDTLFAIIRRIIKGKSLKAILLPDKGHLHHRLIAKGYTQRQAVLILYGVSATFGMFAIILLESGWWKALSFALLVIVIVALGYKEMFGTLKKEKVKNTSEKK